MIINPLINGIVTKWVATSALTTAFPVNAAGPFREVAPSGTAFPFCVLEVVPFAPLTDAYGNKISADIAVVFRVIGEGHAAMADKMQTILTAFDNATLTLTGGTMTGVYRDGEPIPTFLGDDYDGSDIWQWAVGYTYHAE